MNLDPLISELHDYLKSREAQQLCQPYRTDPLGALGALFESLSRKAASEPIRNLRNWIRVNARGLLKNFLRSENKPLVKGNGTNGKTRARVSFDSVNSARFAEVREDFDCWERVQRVRQELARLSPKQREALLAKTGIHPFANSCRDLAKVLKVSPQAVSNWAEAAEKRLRPRLENLL